MPRRPPPRKNDGESQSAREAQDAVEERVESVGAVDAVPGDQAGDADRVDGDDTIVVASLEEEAGGEMVPLPVAGDGADTPTDGDAATEGAGEEGGVDAGSEDVDAAAPGPARAAPRSVSEIHLKGILESLVFAADRPLGPGELARLTRADLRDVRRLLTELRDEYRTRGIQLEEIAGGWQFRSAAANAPFVRELLKARPVRLTRAQLETLAILAYRQPITRPEVDEIRGVDSGSAIKVLLERDLIRILGRKEDVGRPVLYGTTSAFLEFFGLKSLRDLPSLREYTELTPESEATLVRELADEPGTPGSEASAEGVAPASPDDVTGGAEGGSEESGPAADAPTEPVHEEASVEKLEGSDDAGNANAEDTGTATP